MTRATLPMLAFAFTAAWSALALADLAPVDAASNADCTLTKKNAEYDAVCTLCTDVDGGLAACQAKAKANSKEAVCQTPAIDGSVGEIWCPPGAGSSAAADQGCSTSGLPSPSPWRALMAIGGLGAAVALVRRRRRA